MLKEQIRRTIQLISQIWLILQYSKIAKAKDTEGYATGHSTSLQRNDSLKLATKKKKRGFTTQNKRLSSHGRNWPKSSLLCAGRTKMQALPRQNQKAQILLHCIPYDLCTWIKRVKGWCLGIEGNTKLTIVR